MTKNRCIDMTEKQYIRLLEDTIEKLDYQVRSITSRNEELEETVKKNEMQLIKEESPKARNEAIKAGIKAIIKRNKEIDSLEKSNSSLVDVIEKKDKEIEYLNGALKCVSTGARGEQGAAGGEDEKIKELKDIIKCRDCEIDRLGKIVANKQKQNKHLTERTSKLSKIIAEMYTSAEVKEEVEEAEAAWKKERGYMIEKLADKQKQNDYLKRVILRL